MNNQILATILVGPLLLWGCGSGLSGDSSFNELQLKDDQRSVIRGQASLIDDVLANDQYPAGSKLSIVSWTQPQQGEVKYLGLGRFEFQAYSDADSGADSFTYQAMADSGERASATVHLNIERSWSRVRTELTGKVIAYGWYEQLELDNGDTLQLWEEPRGLFALHNDQSNSFKPKLHQLSSGELSQAYTIAHNEEHVVFFYAGEISGGTDYEHVFRVFSLRDASWSDPVQLPQLREAVYNNPHSYKTATNQLRFLNERELLFSYTQGNTLKAMVLNIETNEQYHEDIYTLEPGQLFEFCRVEILNAQTALLTWMEKDTLNTIKTMKSARYIAANQSWTRSSSVDGSEILAIDTVFTMAGSQLSNYSNVQLGPLRHFAWYDASDVAAQQLYTRHYNINTDSWSEAQKLHTNTSGFFIPVNGLWQHQDKTILLWRSEGDTYYSLFDKLSDQWSDAVLVNPPAGAGFGTLRIISNQQRSFLSYVDSPVTKFQTLEFDFAVNDNLRTLPDIVLNIPQSNLYVQRGYKLILNNSDNSLLLSYAAYNESEANYHLYYNRYTSSWLADTNPEDGIQQGIELFNLTADRYGVNLSVDISSNNDATRISFFLTENRNGLNPLTHAFFAYYDSANSSIDAQHSQYRDINTYGKLSIANKGSHTVYLLSDNQIQLGRAALWIAHTMPGQRELVFDELDAPQLPNIGLFEEDDQAPSLFVNEQGNIVILGSTFAYQASYLDFR